MTNEELRNYPGMKCVHEIIEEYATKHEWLLHPIKVQLIQILNKSQDIRRPKRTKPYEIVGCILNIRKI